MSKAGLKEFFATWYGKLVFAVLTVLLGTGSLFVSTIPYRASQKIRAIEQEVSILKADTNARLVKIETHLEWIVRRMGGNP